MNEEMIVGSELLWHNVDLGDRGMSGLLSETYLEWEPCPKLPSKENLGPSKG